MPKKDSVEVYLPFFQPRAFRLRTGAIVDRRYSGCDRDEKCGHSRGGTLRVLDGQRPFGGVVGRASRGKASRAARRLASAYVLRHFVSEHRFEHRLWTWWRADRSILSKEMG